MQQNDTPHPALPLRGRVGVGVLLDLLFLCWPIRLGVQRRCSTLIRTVYDFKHAFLPLAYLTRMIYKVMILIVPERSQGRIKLLFSHDIPYLFLIQGSRLLYSLLEMLER